MSWTYRKRLQSEISVAMIADFSINLYNEGYETGTINSARSAINFYTLNEILDDNDKIIKKIFKYFYKMRPIIPKHKTFWPVSKLQKFFTFMAPYV